MTLPPEIISTFAQNGPWAIVAGFLLWQVIQAWTGDRKQLNELLTEFRHALDKLSGAVEALREEIAEIRETHNK